MAKPLSDDLRKRIVAVISSGTSCRAAAAQFDVSPSTAIKLWKRYCETDSVRPAKFGGHRKCLLEPHHAFILDMIETSDHVTLHGLKERLAAERGIMVSHDTVWRFLRRHGQSFKKNAVRQ